MSEQIPIIQKLRQVIEERVRLSNPDNRREPRVYSHASQRLIIANIAFGETDEKKILKLENMEDFCGDQYCVLHKNTSNGSLSPYFGRVNKLDPEKGSLFMRAMEPHDAYRKDDMVVFAGFYSDRATHLNKDREGHKNSTEAMESMSIIHIPDILGLSASNAKNTILTESSLADLYYKSGNSIDILYGPIDKWYKTVFLDEVNSIKAEFGISIDSAQSIIPITPGGNTYPSFDEAFKEAYSMDKGLPRSKTRELARPFYNRIVHMGGLGQAEVMELSKTAYEIINRIVSGVTHSRGKVEEREKKNIEGILKGRTYKGPFKLTTLHSLAFWSLDKNLPYEVIEEIRNGLKKDKYFLKTYVFPGNSSSNLSSYIGTSFSNSDSTPKKNFGQIICKLIDSSPNGYTNPSAVCKEAGMKQGVKTYKKVLDHALYTEEDGPVRNGKRIKKYKITGVKLVNQI